MTATEAKAFVLERHPTAKAEPITLADGRIVIEINDYMNPYIYIDGNDVPWLSVAETEDLAWIKAAKRVEN